MRESDMTRPQLRVLAHGFKPQVAADLVGISKTTQRYWRNHIDPNGQSSTFSSGRLLAYRILKVLVYRRGLSVESLQRCDMASLFEHCEQVTLAVLGQSFLLINAETAQLSFHERRPELSEEDADLDAQVIALKSIVSAHREALELAGHDPAQPLRQTLQAPGLMVIRKQGNRASDCTNFGEIGIC
jgi:hypothetical protein